MGVQSKRVVQGCFMDFSRVFSRYFFYVSGTQLPHLWNKRSNLWNAACWRGVWLQHYDQHCDRSNLMMTPEQLSLSLGWKFIKMENGYSILGLLGKIPLTLLRLRRTPFKFEQPDFINKIFPTYFVHLSLDQLNWPMVKTDRSDLINFI